MLENHIDDLFEALYGRKCDSSNKKYSKIYKHESKEIIYRFNNWVYTMNNCDVSRSYVNVYSVCSILLYFENVIIGNKLNINHELFRKLSSLLTYEINKEKYGKRKVS